ncbi:interferon-induced very large GTPase 1 [Sphaeramia orbicularis]|uniref:Interferon-induced very large GTPase 1-like n=1 Tax=Sphaeramia orbicularis TaxID=375764 RepID=A0A673AX84_9TELE|nr:interferon-induced very large GTPase 1-like [Sphaeramia orbicularis]XP_030008958.1 interferon-induced very large GTPase 1-like [Sphaeramia orbicularis]
MSVKLSRKLSSKKKQNPKASPQADVLSSLGLEAFGTTQLDPASMLDINTWTLENPAPKEPKNLPNAFLHRLWLLSSDARSPCCTSPPVDVGNEKNSAEETINGFGGDKECAINPLDLVTAVFMSSNTFLQQEITEHMVQCQFAVPLVLPNVDPEEPSSFLLWPLRGVMNKWKSHFLDQISKVQEGNLATTCMPLISCVKLGHCSVSKSQVLNHLMSGLKLPGETFLHRGMAGGQLPRRLSNGLVEIGWYLPTGETDRDIFPVPVVISNLRGDAGAHEKCLNLLCQASSAVVVFCGNLREKDKQLLALCRNTARDLILIDVSDNIKNENSVVGFIDQNLEEHLGLPQGSVVQGQNLSEEELANRLCDVLKVVLPDKLRHVTLEAAAQIALKLDLIVDEGPICKKAMATVDEMLKGLDEGSEQFREKELPLQGPLWIKLAEIEKNERKLRKEGKENDLERHNKKKDVLLELSSYKMTKAMKIFTDALFTTDKVERTYFLRWMKLKLHLMQTRKQNTSENLHTNMQAEKTNGLLEKTAEEEDVANDDLEDSDSFCTDSTFEEGENEEPLVNTDQDLEELNEPELSPDKLDSTPQETKTSSENHVETCPLPYEPERFVLGLEHFLREMGLIFELTHISPGSGSQNVLRLPSLAADLLLYGIPLEIMDGDASNIPLCWLGCVFAELKRRLPQDKLKTRVMTMLGVHDAKNAKVLSVLFGIHFAGEWKGSARGVYVVALCVPIDLREEMECDFLLLIDVEGFCSMSLDHKSCIKDNEMATVATGLSDILMLNITSNASSEFESNFAVIVSALLRIRECGSMPICQFLVQEEGINTILQASQLKRVSQILQTETGDTKMHSHAISTVHLPWCITSPCEPVNSHYSNMVMTLKQKLFRTLKKCSTKSEASGLAEFTGHLCAVWDAVKAESFSVSLQDTRTALAFSMLCTELSQWESCFLEHVESWLKEAKKRILTTKAKTLETAVQNDLLNELRNEATETVDTGVKELKSKIEDYLMKDDHLKTYSDTFRPILMGKLDNLQDQTQKEVIQKLETLKENHCSSTQLKNFETLLEKEQESKLHELLENSKTSKALLQDSELEEEFEGVWSKILSDFDFRPSETDDITARVTGILKENLISRGLQKHIKKLEVMGQNQPSGFQVYDEHFGYRSRLKHMFEDNNRYQRIEAQQLACNIIDGYNQFVADKSSIPSDFSDSYITELLENVEKMLKEKSMEIRSAFEVDLKVYLCNAACKDFQKLHDRYAKDTELLTCINTSKTAYLAEFIYQFRKRDQCRRVAQEFISMVVKPIVFDYIYRPLGMYIVEQIQGKAQEYRSPLAFYQSLLEELMKEDHFESFLRFVLNSDDFRQKKIKQTVVAHVSESNSLNKWRQQRLGEIVGKVASAVSQTEESNNGLLSDVKPLLERVYLTLEKDIDVDISRASLDGPLFNITTEWDRFVTCLMELLAAMRLDLSQEFSQTVDATHLLQSLPVQPQDYLFDKLRGCEKHCPACKAPCEVEDRMHDVHKALLHWPKGVLPHDPCSLSSNSPENMTHDNNHENMDNQDSSSASPDPHSLPPNGSFSHEDSWESCMMPIAYWRYVLVRFNDSFAREYKQNPTEIPEEWSKITQEDAMGSLKEVFISEQC